MPPRAGRRACTSCAARSACSPARSPRWPTKAAADPHPVALGTPAMALGTRRSRRPSIDIWPGFVDALAQLLMVIIFVLLVFTAGQFLLSDALSGRDRALQQLQLQLNELSDLLAIEKRSSAELRTGSASLTAQLQAAIAEREALTTRVAELAAKAEQEVARADQATGKLRGAETIVAADKEKVELQLRQSESLPRDLQALKTVRADLESKIA